MNIPGCCAIRRTWSPCCPSYRRASTPSRPAPRHTRARSTPPLPSSAIARTTANAAASAPPCSPTASQPAKAACPSISSRTKNSAFPSKSDAPIIMIGPGTGIAPFRGFLHERRALGATGKNWLFFGERCAATDFLYREELESMHNDNFLTRLDLAFSRDQDHKIYVQDKMLEQAPQFWSWLQDGACIYVCGDATRMAKDVDAMLHTIVEQQGGLKQEAAIEYVQTSKISTATIATSTRFTRGTVAQKEGPQMASALT